jgi:hypothetical protein
VYIGIDIRAESEEGKVKKSQHSRREDYLSVAALYLRVEWRDEIRVDVARYSAGLANRPDRHWVISRRHLDSSSPEPNQRKKHHPTNSLSPSSSSYTMHLAFAYISTLPTLYIVDPGTLTAPLIPPFAFSSHIFSSFHPPRPCVMPFQPFQTSIRSA